ncbi:hypothetical protein Poli38472_002810 [Pythium oligandrum]|uniref:Ion transport domain-containing protein n=1 Tax=Pythium oligandrum TaxID=41045 RepID=A0A8K1C5T5_PYTOL|nr:hypothetical protein Poli38472_002810 [Pythium oligandrum]|eukprot:TMW56885.1 hypothetical protein Poli38472_002810 [Pythium oligandrum]
MAAWRRDHAVAWALPALHLLLLVVFFVLDLRDLYVKALWLGPYMRYGFHATWTSTFAEASLVSSTNLSAFQSGDEVDFLTGWPSFLEKCEAIHASNGFFHSARGINCALGSSSRRVVSSELVFVADMRVDSVAWSACKLLYLNRRPPICQENVVAEFLRRYRLADPILTPESMAEPYSDAEREILRLLELIGRSYPLSDVVCVEGFQHSGPGHYTATIFGCASANIFEAAFVGLDATSFADLQRELAWLTSDVLNIMGLEFVIRQNSRSGFVTSVDPGDHLLLSHHTDINFSSFGHFYVALIILDIVLLSFHTHSALETASVLLLPLWGTQDAEDINRLTKDYSWTILYRSLYRSPLIVLLTLVSGVLSWQFQLPNSIVWSWNEDSTGKTHALLATMRVWMIVNCVLNQLWSLFAVISEHHAYHVVTRTFISTIEVLVISGCVAILRLSAIFSAGTIKYQLEHQRQLDDKSFLNHEAFANSFNEELDYLLVTTREVLVTVYSPLFATILNSLLAITVYLAVKGDSSGWTPLLEAAQEGQIAICKVLLANGATPDLAVDDVTPLRATAEVGNEIVTQWLLEQPGTWSGTWDPKFFEFLLAKTPGSAPAYLDRFASVLNHSKRGCVAVKYSCLRSIYGEPHVPVDETALALVVKCANARDILSHRVLKYVMRVKWRSFARAKFRREFAAYVVLLSSYFIPTIWADPNWIQLTSTFDYWVASFRGISWICSLYLLVRVEWNEFRGDSARSYFSSFWNWLNIITYIATMLSIPVEFNESLAEQRNSILALITVSLWVNLLQFLQVSTESGLLIAMMSHMVKDVYRFVLLYTVFIFGYSGAFYILLRGSTGFDNFTNSFITVFLMLFGAIDYSVFSDKSIHGWRWHMGNFLLMSHLVGVVIVLLNILIAMMATTYSDVWEAAEAEALQSHAQAILRKEKSLRQSERTKKFYELLTPEGSKLRKSKYTGEIN